MTTTSATIDSGPRTRFFLRLARAMPEQVSEKAVSHTTKAEIADLAQRTSDFGLRLELAGPSVKPGRGGPQSRASAISVRRSADTVPPEGRTWSRERSDGVLIRTSGCGGSCDSAR